MDAERIIDHRTDSRLYSGEKPKYKDLTYFGEQQLGNFILTDRRILFLRKTSIARTLGAAAVELAGWGGFLAGLPAALVVAGTAGNRLASAAIKPEEVERVLHEDPESLAIPLESVVEADSRRAYMTTAYLTVKYNTPQCVSACSFVFGTAAKKQKELADSIMTAKRNLTRQMPSATLGGSRFCTSCGEKIPAGSKFCPKCGGAQQVER
jgi:hypothetical protein